MINELPDNCNAKDVQGYFRLKSVETVRRWVRRGIIRAYKLPNGAILIKRDDVLAFEKERQELTTNRR